MVSDTENPHPHLLHLLHLLHLVLQDEEQNLGAHLVHQHLVDVLQNLDVLNLVGYLTLVDAHPDAMGVVLVDAESHHRSVR